MNGIRNILTVSQINEYMKLLADSDPQLSEVWVRGEISNFTNHYKTGHFYFTLKDGSGLLKTVMFRSYTEKLRFAPDNGMKVVVHGRISVFVRDGVYQLYADGMEPDGVGALYVAFEQLKARLSSEGLFSSERKRPLPPMPERIGLVTSVTGAAIRDMINILGRRYPMCDVVIYPSAVQGESAPAELAAGIRAFNLAGNVDLIIIGRGGGSLEDLFAFNDEGLARTVASSAVPVVSAVGHETDFTICDFASDLRAPTPSAAAELAVPDSADLRSRLAFCESQLRLLAVRKIESARARVDQISASRALRSPEVLLDEKRMMLVSLAARLQNVASEKEKLCRASLAAAVGKLEALNPLSVISRGYGAIYGERGEIIKSTGQLRVGQSISVRLSDGNATAEIKSVERNGGGK